MKIINYSQPLLLLASLLFVPPGESGQTNTAPTELTPAGYNFAAINTYILEQMQQLHIPGVALGIIQNDHLVHLHSFGVADNTGRPVTAQTPFRIGSITKSFTALAVMQLVETGKIDLDAPVQHYLPWFRVADAQASAQITVRHLLNQTSGISTLAGNAYWDSQDSLEATVRRLHSVPLSAPVGTRFQYSNINYSIAGLIVATVSGQSYADYVKQHIFAPLEMRHSHITAASALADNVAVGHLYSMGRVYADIGVAPPVYQPAGFVSASVEDMSHYVVAQLNGGRFNDTTVLTAKTMAQLHQPGIFIGEVPTGPKDTYYGMGWVIGPINDMPTIWHNGDTGRYHAMVIMAPPQHLGIVLLANASGLEHLVAIDDVAKGVFALLIEQTPANASPRTLLLSSYWGILLTPLLLLLGIARGWQRWRRGDFIGLAQHPHSRRKQLWRILWMVIPNLGLAMSFIFILPQVTSLPLTALRILYPDLAYALFAAIAIGISWSLVYTAMVLRLWNRAA